MVPVIAQLPQIPRHHANAGVEHEHPEHPGDGRGHGVGPDQQRAIGARRFHQPVGHDRQKQRRDHRRQSDQRGKDRRGQERRAVIGVPEQVFEISKPHELRREAEGIGNEERLPDRLPCRIEEEHRRDKHLRGNEAERQEPAFERDTFFHARSGAGCPAPPYLSGWLVQIGARADCRVPPPYPVPPARPCRRTRPPQALRR